LLVPAINFFFLFSCIIMCLYLFLKPKCWRGFFYWYGNIDFGICFRIIHMVHSISIWWT
jgi:hypothetical protein